MRLARTAPWDGFVRRATPAPTRRPEGGKNDYMLHAAPRREPPERGTKGRS